MRLRLFATVALLLGCTAGVAAQTAPAGVVEYYHVDALGSVRAVTSATGAVVRTHHYHPFGEGVESGADPMRFTGKPRDLETGLDYFGARYYAPRIARFTTVDPVLNTETAAGDPQRWNRYAYARGNPKKFVDPDGRDIVLALHPAIREHTKAFRASMSKLLGSGFFAKAIDTLLAPFAPTTGREAADSLMMGASPGLMSVGGTGGIARLLGFVDFAQSGSFIGGTLSNGATAAVSVSQQGSVMSATVSFLKGPSGTLLHLEAGLMRAAATQEASTLRLIAANVNERMAAWLQRKGFWEQVIDGSTVWVKEVAVKK